MLNHSRREIAGEGGRPSFLPSSLSTALLPFLRLDRLNHTSAGLGDVHWNQERFICLGRKGLTDLQSEIVRTVERVP